MIKRNSACGLQKFSLSLIIIESHTFPFLYGQCCQPSICKSISLPRKFNSSYGPEPKWNIRRCIKQETPCKWIILPKLLHLLDYHLMRSDFNFNFGFSLLEKREREKKTRINKVVIERPYQNARIQRWDILIGWIHMRKSLWKCTTLWNWDSYVFIG